MIKKQCGYSLCKGAGSFACTHCEGQGSYLGFDFRPGLTAEEARQEGKKKITCYFCKGTGVQICPVCNGEGSLACGRILLDASTIVLAIELAENNRLPPPDTSLPFNGN